LLKNISYYLFLILSALDSKSERLVQETINTITKDHTVIIVAHRLSTIQNANKIVVLQNGKIIEVGTHNELMRKKGHYFNLFNIQHDGSQN
jgi:ABC-type multidrug transport system fused ATPase/permease subunit